MTRSPILPVDVPQAGSSNLLRLFFLIFLLQKWFFRLSKFFLVFLSEFRNRFKCSLSNSRYAWVGSVLLYFRMSFVNKCQQIEDDPPLQHRYVTRSHFSTSFVVLIYNNHFNFHMFHWEEKAYYIWNWIRSLRKVCLSENCRVGRVCLDIVFLSWVFPWEAKAGPAQPTSHKRAHISELHCAHFHNKLNLCELETNEHFWGIFPFLKSGDRTLFTSSPPLQHSSFLLIQIKLKYSKTNLSIGPETKSISFITINIVSILTLHINIISTLFLMSINHISRPHKCPLPTDGPTLEMTAHCITIWSKFSSISVWKRLFFHFQTIEIFFHFHIIRFFFHFHIIRFFFHFHIIEIFFNSHRS